MPQRLNPAPMSLGGGGASAPSTPEPMTAPGVFRPDWPSPKYAQLPWQRKLRVFEAYADSVIEHGVPEDTQALRDVANELQRYVGGKPLNVGQLDAALSLLGQTSTHTDLWRKALNIDSAPVRGSGDHFNAHDASEILRKLRSISR